MAETTIEWTAIYLDDGTIIPGYTFNPWEGCVKVSPECDNCYAETRANRFRYDVWGANKPRQFRSDAYWKEPTKWNRQAEQAGNRARVFCASLADVFESRADLDAERDRLWALIRQTPALDWLLLTKRPNMIRRYLPDDLIGVHNVWLGVSVGSQDYTWRMDALRGIPAVVRFVSAEPLLEPLGLDLAGIHWLIIVGESGARARPMDLDWVRGLMRQGQATGIPVFVKQLGTAWAKASGTYNQHEKGGDPDLWPADLRVREMPAMVTVAPLQPALL